MTKALLIAGSAAFAFAGAPGGALAAEDALYLDGAGRYADIVALTEGEFASGAERGAARLGWLCIAYGKVKQYAKALGCADELEARIRVGDTTMNGRYIFEYRSDARPVPDMVRADSFVELGRYAEALKAGDRALALADEGNPEATMSQWPAGRFRVLILGTLVVAASLEGDKPRALGYLQALEETSIPYVGAPIVALNKRNSLARAYLALGQYDKALENLEATVTASVGLSVLNALSPYGARGDSLADQTEIPRRLMRGKALSELGKDEEAKLELDPILANPRVKDMGDLHWLALYERGRIAERQKEPRAAELYAAAVEVIELQRASINSEASKIGFVGNKQAVYERLVALLMDQQRASDAFDYVERSKARALVDMLASKKDFSGPAMEPGKARLILAQLDAADLAARTQAMAGDGKEAVTRSLDVARKEIQQAAPELSSLVTVTSVPPEKLKSLIGGNEALVEYYYQDKDLYAFILDRTRLTAFKLSAEGIAAEVQAFRSALQEPGSAAWQDGARKLHQRLWQPIESSIGARNVIVVAHGALHYLPFAALQAPDGKLLIDQYSLRFLPSASVLNFLRPASAGKEGLLLALGNPDLGDPSKDLKFAESEARAVAGLFPQSRLLLRLDASESNLKKAGGVFSRIHFATHGQFRADDPLRSGLYLAKDADNDGLLTVSELYSMTLDTDLVTLSACETGLGKVANGDDVVGLTRGFLYAGSRSIVASLWSVEDKSTAALMGAFYENLPRLSKQEALREAQLKTRQEFPHPFFWAAFQLTGRAD